MSTETVNYVDARFGGESIRFELKRDEIVGLENSLNASAYQTVNRLVLSAAIPISRSGLDPASPEAMLRRMGKAVAGLESAVVSPFVKEVLIRNPPARYAVLALKVLEAALFGISPDEATFDEAAAEEAT